MRIFAFPSIYPFDRPGMTFTGVFGHYQYKGLIRNGVELKVIIPVLWNPPYPLSEFFPEWKKMRMLAYPGQRAFDGVTIYHPRIPNMRPNRIFSKPYPEKYIDTVIKFFADNNITLDPSNDIFYAQWLPEAHLVQQAAHKLGVKCAILAIGDDVIVWPRSSDNNHKSFEQLLLNADLRMANADYLMKEANKIIGKNLPYKVVYFGVDHSFFKPAGKAEMLKQREKYKLPSDKVVVLTVATALVRKGWFDLFDAMAEIRKTNSNFVVAAVHAGLKDFDMMDEVTKRGLNDVFVNVGEVPPLELNQIYNAADIFCLPSHWEGLAMVVIEAMSSGLPVITTDVCGQPEAIANESVGILIPSKRPDILAKELRSLIEDVDKRKFLGEHARDYIVNVWGDFDANAAKLKKLLEETLRG